MHVYVHDFFFFSGTLEHNPGWIYEDPELCLRFVCLLLCSCSIVMHLDDFLLHIPLAPCHFVRQVICSKSYCCDILAPLVPFHAMPYFPTGLHTFSYSKMYF